MSNSDLIKNINEWQKYPFVHPLTCGNDSKHELLQAKEINGKVILYCLDCDYIQNWIPDVINSINDIKVSNESNPIFKHFIK